MGNVNVTELDHIVLDVSNVERAVAFYCDELGLEPVRLEQWRNGDVPFPSARITEATIIDFFERERSGENMNHFALVVEDTDLVALAESGRFDVVEGPGTRFGAQGTGTALYIRDPDGNTVELRSYV